MSNSKCKEDFKLVACTFLYSFPIFWWKHTLKSKMPVGQGNSFSFTFFPLFFLFYIQISQCSSTAISMCSFSLFYFFQMSNQKSLYDCIPYREEFGCLFSSRCHFIKPCIWCFFGLMVTVLYLCLWRKKTPCPGLSLICSHKQRDKIVAGSNLCT